MSEAASKFWDKHVVRLKEEGLLIPATASRFEDLCRIYEQLRLLEDQLRNEGMVIESNGKQATNPALKAFCDIEKIVSSLAREFGLTPMARARMNLSRSVKKERTAFDDFLNDRL
jgi:P27 family predicted phage terminase small subunit